MGNEQAKPGGQGSNQSDQQSPSMEDDLASRTGPWEGDGEAKEKEPRAECLAVEEVVRANLVVCR